MRPSRSKRHKQKRRTKRRVQRGGSRNLLDGSDAPILANAAPIDFNARFQPTVVTNVNGPALTPYQTAHEPFAVWTPPTPPNMYTIICWDPDAQPKSFLHWLVTNCAGENASEGTVVTPWMKPDPPPGSGEHRYVIGLFAQKDRLTVSEMKERGGFNPTTFATTNNLTPLAYKGFRVVARDAPPASASASAAPAVTPNVVNLAAPLPANNQVPPLVPVPVPVNLN